MRHLVVGQPCPIDGAAAGRTHCSDCPSFLSYRSRDGVATIGCDWGEDVVGWLRREMGAPQAPPRNVPERPSTTPGRDAWVGRGAGASLGMFLAAFGVGLVLSALERD